MGNTGPVGPNCKFVETSFNAPDFHLSVWHEDVDGQISPAVFCPNCGVSL